MTSSSPTGPSAPQNWVSDFGKGNDHVLVTLHAISPEAMKSYSDRLSDLFVEGDAFRQIWRTDRITESSTLQPSTRAVIFDPVGVDASDQNLLHKGRPFIMRRFSGNWLPAVRTLRLFCFPSF